MMSRVFLLTLLACTAVATVSAGSLQVQLDSGAILGFTENGVDKWMGIPYAAPPVGNLRFATPQPPQSWSGVRETKVASVGCPQLYDVLKQWIGDEDCLYANVWAPANRTSSKPLPVFLWIYGGGWMLGDGLEFGLYDGQTLANRHNVIVVTFNYRLGALGFLALKAFQNENPAGSVGSYGVYDQLHMLHWVQNNIAAFGGDPTQVTVGGESAGAFSICILMTSPLAKGLFRSAILQSGTCSSQIFYSGLAESQAWSNAFATQIGCDPTQLNDAQMLTCLRNLPMQSVMGLPATLDWPGYHPLMFPSMNWAATIDGVLLKDVPWKLIAKGQFNSLQGVMMGTNLDEGSIFIPRMQSVVPEISVPLIEGDMTHLFNHFFNFNQTVNQLVEAMYPLANFESPTKQAEAAINHFFFSCSTSRALLAMSSFGIPSWLYQFSFHGSWIKSLGMGVYHSSEIEFVFGHAWPPVIHQFDADDQIMADRMMYYWANFIKTGNPNGDGTTPVLEAPWPNYNPATMQHMELDLPGGVRTKLYEQQCLMWDQITQWVPPVQMKKIASIFEQVIATQ